jgi:hypothetical protein
MMDPAAMIAARSRNKAQPIGIAASPMQGLAIAHCRKVIELDEPTSVDLAAARRFAQCRVAIDTNESSCRCRSALEKGHS